MAREGGRSVTLYMRPALQSAVFPNLVHGGNIYCWYASEYTTLRTTYISHSGWLVVNVQTRLCVGGSYCFASARVDSVWSKAGNQADNSTEYWSSSGLLSPFFWWQMKLHLTKRNKWRARKQTKSISGEQWQSTGKKKGIVCKALWVDWTYQKTDPEGNPRKRLLARRNVRADVSVGQELEQPLDRLPECQK